MHFNPFTAEDLLVSKWCDAKFRPISFDLHLLWLEGESNLIDFIRVIQQKTMLKPDTTMVSKTTALKKISGYSILAF